MIAGILFQGSGLGDQLFRYITVRSLAEEKGYKWGMCTQKNFKGSSFMNLDLGIEPPDGDIFTQPNFIEKGVHENGNDIRSYDPEINFIKDRTLIDGSFEDDKYWRRNLAKINGWLSVEPLVVPDDLCVIGFRGGEYASNPDLFLMKEYWDKSVRIMGDKKYEVHTDDPTLAKTFFPYPVIDNEQISHSQHTNMGYNWRAARYAKHAIIPNSAFFILPRILKHLEDPTAITIAPRYWARHNTKVWARPACYYPEFTYV